MKIEFLSKVYVGTKKKFSIIPKLIIMICIIMILCMLFKLLMDDFNISDLSAMLTSLLIIFISRGHRKEDEQYADTLGEITFDKEDMKITYANVYDDTKKENFLEETHICYDDIEIIEYGKELSCFRIVARCMRKRCYLNSNTEYLMENGEKTAETFIHVSDEDVASEIKNKLQKITKSIIRVLEMEQEG